MFRDFIRKILTLFHVEKFFHLNFWWSAFKLDKQTEKLLASIKLDNLVNILADRMMPIILDKVLRMPSVSEKFSKLKDKFRGKETIAPSPKETEEHANKVEEVSGAIKHIAEGLISSIPGPSLNLKKTTSVENIG